MNMRVGTGWQALALGWQGLALGYVGLALGWQGLTLCAPRTGLDDSWLLLQGLLVDQQERMLDQMAAAWAVPALYVCAARAAPASVRGARHLWRERLAG